MTNEEILQELKSDSLLNRVRKVFYHHSAKIEQAGEQQYPVSIWKIREMEFEAAQALIDEVRKG